MQLKYFAYGSNMHLNRIRQRIGHCPVHAVAALRGFTLAFHKKSDDGSGKCGVFPSDDPAHTVHGVVLDIHAEQKRILDEYEGIGNGYDERHLQVTTAQGDLAAFAYMAHETFVDPRLKPYRWYKDFVLEGARQHGLPVPYIALIEKIAAVEDPNRERANRNRLILQTAY